MPHLKSIIFKHLVYSQIQYTFSGLSIGSSRSIADDIDNDKKAIPGYDFQSGFYKRGGPLPLRALKRAMAGYNFQSAFYKKRSNLHKSIKRLSGYDFQSGFYN